MGSELTLFWAFWPIRGYHILFDFIIGDNPKSIAYSKCTYENTTNTILMKIQSGTQDPLEPNPGPPGAGPRARSTGPIRDMAKPFVDSNSTYEITPRGLN